MPTGASILGWGRRNNHLNVETLSQQLTCIILRIVRYAHIFYEGFEDADACKLGSVYKQEDYR